MKRASLFLFVPFVLSAAACRKPAAGAAESPPMTVTFTRPASAVPTPPRPPAEVIAPVPVVSAFPGVVRLAANEYEIDKTAFKPDPSWMRNAKLDPQTTGGKIEGLRVSFTAASPLSQLGLATGDLITRVNGLDFEHAATALNPTTLAAMTDLVVTVQRAGRLVNITYHLRTGAGGIRALGGLRLPRI